MAPRCDGVATSLISALVLDAFGQPRAGVAVHFAVNAVAVVSPINAVSGPDGVAYTTFRGYSAGSIGVPVVVTSGTQEDSILIHCQGFDTDADGMPNTYEHPHSCLNQNIADSNQDPDGDFVMSFGEFLIGSDPCDADTDNDLDTDQNDNCVLIPNANQLNSDITLNPPGDLLGDACDPDDDNDGCTDAQESGTIAALGGSRDPLYAWDFYDVNANASIDLTDTLAILARFGLAPGAATYAATYDRYAPNSQQPWRTAPATGANIGIDLADALLNLRSFGHTCA